MGISPSLLPPTSPHFPLSWGRGRCRRLRRQSVRGPPLEATRETVRGEPALSLPNGNLAFSSSSPRPASHLSLLSAHSFLPLPVRFLRKGAASDPPVHLFSLRSAPNIHPLLGERRIRASSAEIGEGSSARALTPTPLVVSRSGVPGKPALSLSKGPCRTTPPATPQSLRSRPDTRRPWSACPELVDWAGLESSAQSNLRPSTPATSATMNGFGHSSNRPLRASSRTSLMNRRC